MILAHDNQFRPFGNSDFTVFIVRHTTSLITFIFITILCVLNLATNKHASVMTNRTLALSAAATGLVSLCLFVGVQHQRNRKRKTNIFRVTPSPLESALPEMSELEIKKLAYPPDYFPGARDVPTPFGTIRVYEFGPETGQKVLFVHGISTPCVSLGGMAHGLVAKGCRVMLFGKKNASGMLFISSQLIAIIRRSVWSRLLGEPASV